MKCPSAVELQRLVDGEPQRSAVMEHAQACALCAQEVAGRRALGARLAEAFAVPVPAGLAERICARLRAAPARRRRGWPRLVAASGGTLLVLLAGLALWTGRSTPAEGAALLERAGANLAQARSVLMLFTMPNGMQGIAWQSHGATYNLTAKDRETVFADILDLDRLRYLRCRVMPPAPSLCEEADLAPLRGKVGVLNPTLDLGSATARLEQLKQAQRAMAQLHDGKWQVDISTEETTRLGRRIALVTTTIKRPEHTTSTVWEVDPATDRLLGFRGYVEQPDGGRIAAGEATVTFDRPLPDLLARPRLPRAPERLTARPVPVEAVVPPGARVRGGEQWVVLLADKSGAVVGSHWVPRKAGVAPELAASEQADAFCICRLLDAASALRARSMRHQGCLPPTAGDGWVAATGTPPGTWAPKTWFCRQDEAWLARLEGKLDQMPRPRNGNLPEDWRESVLRKLQQQGLHLSSYRLTPEAAGKRWEDLPADTVVLREMGAGHGDHCWGLNARGRVVRLPAD